MKTEDFPRWIQNIVRDMYRDPPEDVMQAYQLRDAYLKSLESRRVRLATVILRHAGGIHPEPDSK